MNFVIAGYQLAPVLPELVLAVGAMALLMLGAFRGQGTTGTVTSLAVVLLIVGSILLAFLAMGGANAFALGFVALYVLAGAAVIGGVIAATIQRLHEISGGEEEDAKRY